MIDFDIQNIVPRFIWQDRNGRAMAKAIEAGLKDFLDVCQLGLDTLNNPDKMPEWRLDEMAWEYNIPYDYTVDIAVKREWIKSAYALSRLYGTPEGIYQYLKAYLDEPIVQEYWEYGGDPFHFWAIFLGSWTPESVKWATLAAQAVKNVRSVLDGFTYRNDWPNNLYVGSALFTYGSAIYKIPEELIEDDWYTDEAGNMLMDEKSVMLTVEG